MSRVYNVLAILFLLLTLGALLFVGVNFLMQTPATATPIAVLPTLVELPTITNTFTPSFTPTFTTTFTFTPTFTLTFTPTATFTLPTVPPTATFTQSLTPSLTPTIAPTLTASPIPSVEPSATITDTITPTLTPVVTDTLVPSATIPPITQQPLPPTPSPFPFALRDQVIFTGNFTNSAGCLWQGIGGQVFDINGIPLTGVRVHVFGAGVDAFAVTGSNTLYGPSGWEIQLGNSVNTNTYIVELQTSNGTQMSPQVQVTFPADCARNLSLVNFNQTRPF